MRIGTVTEIKQHEYRVGLTPESVVSYVRQNHQLYVQSGAGAGSGFSDEAYKAAGATILDTAAQVWEMCDMVVKVKEPLAEEYPLMREGQIIYTYLHLAADKELTDALLNCKAKAVAYETIRDAGGGLPLLRPMSEIAGKLSVQAGARCLEKPMGGRGVLLGGSVGVHQGDVVILGGGVVGTAAMKMAIGLGANVTILDTSLDRLTYLDDVYANRIQTLFSTAANIENAISQADLVIGAVLIPGAAAPKLIKREHLKNMREGAVIVDVAVDQGGCCETIRRTYHDDPTYVVDGIIHYGVANMPGAVSRTSTFALTNATLNIGLKIAKLGLEAAVRADKNLLPGVNCYAGHLTCEEVAQAFDMKYTPVMEVLA
ncbi:MAG: alanine dehydrogenase [Defluviitaleaceae bacterium]|nr:alanine dehydrogenase [Defluviitaleaceae bacterium]MCL2238571.1 alanine dehydrogenase [Defluviitaleaceae bacterium]